MSESVPRYMQRKKLTIKQKRFVKEIVKDGNGTQAIIRAGYDVENEKVASAMAVENLAKPSIKEAIETALVDLDLTPNWILKQHKDIVDLNKEKDGMIAERGLENIGKIAGLYPSSQTNLDLSDGKLKISWES